MAKPTLDVIEHQLSIARDYLLISRKALALARKLGVRTAFHERVMYHRLDAVWDLQQYIERRKDNAKRFNKIYRNDPVRKAQANADRARRYRETGK